MLEIYCPGAAGAITSIDAELMDNGADETIKIKQYAFDKETNKARWQTLTGKTITSNEVILTSSEVIAARISPVNVQATDVDFSLTNSKKETIPGVIFNAKEYKGYVTSDNVNSRADYGNGLYTLTMKPLEVKNENTVTNTFKLTSGGSNILYALNAENACLGKYQFAVTLNSTTATISEYLIDGDDANPVVAGTQMSISDASKAYTYPDGFYSEKELIDIINMTDLYIHASDAEIEALGCLEAFRCGVVPVISDSKLSATNQFAIDELNLFEHGNALSLRDRIDYWYEHKVEKEKRSQEYITYSEQYSIDYSVKKLEEMFYEAIRDYKKSK